MLRVVGPNPLKPGRSDDCLSDVVRTHEYFVTSASVDRVVAGAVEPTPVCHGICALGEVRDRRAVREKVIAHDPSPASPISHGWVLAALAEVVPSPNNCVICTDMKTHTNSDTMTAKTPVAAVAVIHCRAPTQSARRKRSIDRGFPHKTREEARASPRAKEHLLATDPWCHSMTDVAADGGRSDLQMAKQLEVDPVLPKLGAKACGDNNTFFGPLDRMNVIRNKLQRFHGEDGKISIAHGQRHGDVLTA